MLKERIITAAIMAAIFFVVLFALPTRWFGVATLLILVGAAVEWARLAGFQAAAARVYAACLGIACLALLFASPDMPAPFVIAACGIATLFWVFVAPAWIRSGWPTQHRLLMTILGVVILGSMWLGLLSLHARSPWLLLATLAVVWLADTGAYFAGRKFGRRKLAPVVSPGKSWEGVYGGLASVAVYAIVLIFLSPIGARAGWLLLVFAIAVAALSVVGDLFESWLKRKAGVKDSGSLLPGHGGLLDRIDALLPAVPLATLLVAWMS